jgi:hypothetical protein
MLERRISKLKTEQKESTTNSLLLLSHPQSRSTVCTIEKSHLRNSVHCLTASVKISDEANRNVFHSHVM